MDLWLIALCIYALVAITSAIPTLIALVKGVKLHDGGESFGSSPNFSEDARIKLTQHFSRIAGTLGYWKNQAEIFRRAHYYTLAWTIPASVVVPFLVQSITPDNASKWFVTLVTAHTAILFALHKGFKVDANFKTWREGESHFYDLYRRMLDRPETFGETEKEQLSKYFDDVENLRMFIRNAEIDNIPTVEEAQKQLSKEIPKTAGKNA